MKKLPTVGRLRAENGRIAVRVLAKTRARNFSFWFQKFLLLAPKEKFFRTTSFATVFLLFLEREKRKGVYVSSVTSDTWRMPHRVGQKCLPLGQL